MKLKGGYAVIRWGEKKEVSEFQGSTVSGFQSFRKINFRIWRL